MCAVSNYSQQRIQGTFYVKQMYTDLGKLRFNVDISQTCIPKASKYSMCPIIFAGGNCKIGNVLLLL